MKQYHTNPYLDSIINTYHQLISHSLFGGRMSRGQYYISTNIIGIISVLIGIPLYYLGGTFETWISDGWGTIVFIINIALIIKRSHDIGRSGWFIFTPWMIFIGITTIRQLSSLIQASLSIILITTIGRIGAICSIITIIWGVVALIMVGAKAGDNTTNQYGDIPSKQHINNSAYWIVCVGLIIINIIITSLAPVSNTQSSPESLIRTSVSTAQQQLQGGNNSETSTISIDPSSTPQEISQQIDESIQQVDQSAQLQ